MIVFSFILQLSASSQDQEDNKGQQRLPAKIKRTSEAPCRDQEDKTTRKDQRIVVKDGAVATIHHQLPGEWPTARMEDTEGRLDVLHPRNVEEES